MKKLETKKEIEIALKDLAKKLNKEKRGPSKWDVEKHLKVTSVYLLKKTGFETYVELKKSLGFSPIESSNFVNKTEEEIEEIKEDILKKYSERGYNGAIEGRSKFTLGKLFNCEPKKTVIRNTLKELVRKEIQLKLIEEDNIVPETKPVIKKKKLDYETVKKKFIEESLKLGRPNSGLPANLCQHLTGYTLDEYYRITKKKYSKMKYSWGFFATQEKHSYKIKGYKSTIDMRLKEFFLKNKRIPTKEEFENINFGFSMNFPERIDFDTPDRVFGENYIEKLFESSIEEIKEEEKVNYTLSLIQSTDIEYRMYVNNFENLKQSDYTREVKLLYLATFEKERLLMNFYSEQLVKSLKEEIEKERINSIVIPLEYTAILNYLLKLDVEIYIVYPNSLKKFLVTKNIGEK